MKNFKDQGDLFESDNARYENNIGALCEMYYCDQKGYPNITIKDVDAYFKFWETTIKELQEFYPEMSDEEYENMVYNEDSPATEMTDQDFTEYLKEVDMTYDY